MRPDAPIIIIGAGRSGSTLLDRMLDAHPDIHMFGETKFFFTDLWKRMLEIREKSLSAIADPDLLMGELAKLGEVELNIIREMFGLDALPKGHWGFKEIWNGDKDAVDWGIYDRIFPRAIWIHLVRNPLHYLRSAIGWTNMEATEEQVAMKLRRWSRLVDVSRNRRSTGRYVEIRYEDLVTHGEQALEPVFRMIGIPVEQACRNPLSSLWVASTRKVSLPEIRFDEIVAELCMEEKLRTFGYTLAADGATIETMPTFDGATATDKAVIEQVVGADGYYQGAFDQLIVMNAADMREAGGRAYGYWMPLLAEKADSLDQPMRSPYVLLEDGRIIGPAHSLHDDIRERGAGRWSHWGQTVIFSSSDKSDESPDPRRNGREYALVRPLSNPPSSGGTS